MKKALIILTTTILFFACSTKQDNRDKIYFIVKHLKTNPKNLDPPPPPIPFYGNYNFILVDTSRIFYHSRHKYYWCGYGVDFSKPTRLYLIPDSVIEIKINNLEHFLSSLPDNSDTYDRSFFATISSPTDTIKNRAFQIITDYFKGKKFINTKIKLKGKQQFIRYNTRNWTEEEQYVITAKIENKKYDPNKVNWKAGFDIEFVPPVTK